MSERMRVIQYGLSPIGSAVARQVVERAALALVQGVDVDPTMVGKDVGETIGLSRSLGFPVGAAREHTEPNIVAHTTSSHLRLFRGQIIETLDVGLNVVSTAGELHFPYLAGQEWRTVCSA